MRLEDNSRFDDPRMTYYKEVYKDSPLWNGRETGKKLIIYAEQGKGDQIQFSRFIPRNNYTILHCDPSLHRLLAPLVNEVLDKDNPELPPHDYHIPSMSLPFIRSSVPYLRATKADVEIEGFKIGIAWEGNPEYANNLMRSCPLKLFKKLPGKLFMLQDQTHLPQEDCEDMELYSIPLNDLYDTATLINAMDLIVSVDTSVLHLTGALGKIGYGIMLTEHDQRWKYNWYPSLRIVKSNTWEMVFDYILKNMNI
jgi:hypothetical protein